VWFKQQLRGVKFSAEDGLKCSVRDRSACMKRRRVPIYVESMEPWDAERCS